MRQHAQLGLEEEHRVVRVGHVERQRECLLLGILIDDEIAAPAAERQEGHGDDPALATDRNERLGSLGAAELDHVADDLDRAKQTRDQRNEDHSDGNEDLRPRRAAQDVHLSPLSRGVDDGSERVSRWQRRSVASTQSRSRSGHSERERTEAERRIALMAHSAVEAWTRGQPQSESRRASQDLGSVNCESASSSR